MVDPTEAIPIFDWLRWVEVPVWFGLAGWLWCHQKNDHDFQVKVTEKLGKLDELDGLRAMLALVVDKLIPERKEF